MPPALCHTCHPPARAASVHERLAALPLLLFRNLQCHSNLTCLTRCIRSARPALAPFVTARDGRSEVIHQGGNIIHRLGACESLDDVLRETAGGQLAYTGGDIDEATTLLLLQQGEEGARRVESTVVVDGQSGFNDVDVEALHGDSGVVDGEVDAVGMHLCEVSHRRGSYALEKGGLEGQQPGLQRVNRGPMSAQSRLERQQPGVCQ